MRYLILLTFIIICSCNQDDPIYSTVDCTEQDCAILNPLTFVAEPNDKSILLSFGASYIIDGTGKTCIPDKLDFYISDNNVDFGRFVRVNPLEETYLIEDLENGNEYFIKMVSLHCELDSIISPVLSVTVGEIPTPDFQDSPVAFEDFRLATDGDRFIYRTSPDDWYLSSFSNPSQRELLVEDAFYAQWKTDDNSEIAAVQKIRVDISTNLQGVTSKRLLSINANSRAQSTIHEIVDHHDFVNEVHSPNQYWIHEFHYSLDKTAIYCVSNKDNGSTTQQEKRKFDNLWKIDLGSGALESLTDFLPISFDFEDFIEDPKQYGNFYLLGGYDGETVAGTLFDSQRIDVHYYNSVERTLSPVFITDNEEQHISIDPRGENLVFVTDKAGKNELWSYNISSQKTKQITNSKNYSPTYRWQHINWISDTEFMTCIRQNGDYKFATFEI